MDRKYAFDSFEEELRVALVKLCTEYEFLNGKLLASPDIDEKWNEFARECVSDAVVNFNEYPGVALAWPAYLGAAVAACWDGDWQTHKDDTYASFYGERGYDDMDEHIVRDILCMPLESEHAKSLSSLLVSCAELTLSLIRHEGFESQSVEAYFVLIRCVKVMYQIGAAIELQRLGYKFEKMSLA